MSIAFSLAESPFAGLWNFLASLLIDLSGTWTDGSFCLSWSRIQDTLNTRSLRFLGMILRVLRLEVTVKSKKV
jgi:hypothetical protein